MVRIRSKRNDNIYLFHLIVLSIFSVESKIISFIGLEINEACCTSVVAALDKFHRRILAVQRLLVSDQPRSFPIITEVARIIADRTADYLLSNWKVQLQAWRDSWSNDKQPHSSVKILEGLLVEQVHHALVALTVP